MDRRLTTIVAADMVGYSRLIAKDEEGTLARVRAIRSELIDPQLEKANARLIKTMGDGLLIEFPSPVAAVRVSLAIQKAMVDRERDQSDDAQVQFRIGINLSDVVIDGEDILGDGVNIAARLESLAPPGGVCVSRAVYDQIRGKLDAPLTALGPQNVKNIPGQIDVWRVEVEGVRPVKAAGKAATPPSLVVLPFNNLSSDPEQEFLADGIVEDVTTELSRFRTLSVIARNSAFTYKSTPKDVREIATELGVKYVVEGSVRRAGDRLRVTAQLVEAETGAQLWAERWDRTMADLFDVQDELTSAIVTGIEPELGAHERTLSRRKPTENLTAWEMAQKGYSRFLEYTLEDFEAAQELYRKAIQLDPDFALAHALSARVHYARAMAGWGEEFAREVQAGLKLAARAITLDPKSDYGHVFHAGLLKFLGRDHDADLSFGIAESLNPSSVVLCMARANAEFAKASPDPSVIEEMASKGLLLSPRDPQAYLFHNQMGLAYLIRNDWVFDATSADAFAEAGRYANASEATLFNAAAASVQIGRCEDAVHYLKLLQRRNPETSAKRIRHQYRFYKWVNKYLETNEVAYEKLIRLGLPPE